MIKHKDQRVGVFVDVSIMYHSAKNLYGGRVNFKNILEEAVGHRKLIRSIAYVVKSNTPEEEVFFEALGKSGFEVKVKDLQIFPGGMKKGDWDVGLAMDAIKLADKLDSVILVTGDGDYVPLVLYLKENKGCQVEIVAFGKTTSQKLIEIGDGFLDISENIDAFLLEGGSRKGKRKKTPEEGGQI
ncbi:MAG: NYN domain-containing protein [Parcubacteria group bacterium]|nr:NYN domain-containing protein [Parcubacteria group bacterium]